MYRFEEMCIRLENLTAMYTQKETYGEVVAFIDGYNTACEGGPLMGFREWLALKQGFGQNLAWSGLVLDLAFPTAPDAERVLSGALDLERNAITKLFALLREFFEERSAGLVAIMASYARKFPEP
jgi:hypothetical protein